MTPTINPQVWRRMQWKKKPATTGSQLSHLSWFWAKPGTSPDLWTQSWFWSHQCDTTPLFGICCQVTCDVCHVGSRNQHPCTTCRGTGSQQAHSVNVKTFAGSWNGLTNRLAGQGEAGRIRPYGDFMASLSMLSKDRFELWWFNHSLHVRLEPGPSSPWDTVHVPTVHGDVDLVIPEGTQTGKKSASVKGPKLTVVLWGSIYPSVILSSQLV